VVWEAIVIMPDFAGKQSTTAASSHDDAATFSSGPGKQTLVEKEYGASGSASASGSVATDGQAAPEGPVDPADAYRTLLVADASFVRGYLDGLKPDETLKIDEGAAGVILSKFTIWKNLNLLHEFVAEVRKQRASGWLAVLLGTKTAWTYLVAVLRPSDRVRLYDMLADGNIDARNTGRFTEDLVEFWDVQMQQDANQLRAAYHRLCEASEEDEPVPLVQAQITILAILTEYRELDQRYRMKGTLLTRFLSQVDDTVRSGDEQYRMLDHIANLMGDNVGRYQELLRASNFKLAGTPIEDTNTLGGAVIEELVAALTTVEDVVAFLASQSDELKKQCVQFLANSASKLPLLIDFIAEKFEEYAEICALGLSYLSARNIVKILQQIDVGRIWDFYKALVTLAATAMFMPQLVAAYFLLPEKTRDELFSAIGRTAFRPLIREAKELVVPIIRELVERYLPVGQGCYFERGLTASVGIAQAGGDSSFWVIRTSGDRLEYNERFSVRGGVDVGKGVGRTEGKKAGEGSQLFWGHELAANASAMMELTTQNQYEFPIFNDDAFVGLLAAFVDIEGAVAVGGVLFEELEQIDPLPYLKKSKIEPKLTGEVNADASTGLRKGKGGEDATHEWKPGEKPEEMGSGIGGMFGAQAGAAIQQLLEIGAALEIEKDGNQHEVSLQLGIKQAGGLRINLPGIGLLANALPPAVDTGTAIKLSCDIEGLAEKAPRMVGSWTLKLVGTTGEMDTYQGSASETEVVLATGGELDSVESFIASLGEATFKRRIGIASGIGKKMLATVDHQKGFTSKLKADYQDAGVKLKGSIDLVFELAAEDTQRVAHILLDVIRHMASVDDPLPKLKDAAYAFVTSGALPSFIDDAASEIGRILRDSFDAASYHVEVGGTVALGEKLGADRSVGGHGYAGSGWIFHDDITEEVKALDPAEMLDIVTDVGSLATTPRAP
jgi:hypothetical protein